MKAFSKRTPEEIYLEWLNEWLTIEEMADNYNLSEHTLTKLISEGYKENQKHKNSTSNV